MKPTQDQIKLALASQAPSGHPLRGYVPKIRKPRAKRQNKEALLQEMICEWLDTQPRILYWANNPQVFVGKMTWGRIKYLEVLKKRGHKKGVLDLTILFLNKKGLATFVMPECKSLTGIVTDEQNDMMKAIEFRGGFTAIVKSLEDLIELLITADY